MAFADVNLAALAWQNLGLHYLLQDGDLPDFASQHLASALIRVNGSQGKGQKPDSASARPDRPGWRQDAGRNFSQRQPAGRQDRQAATGSDRSQTGGQPGRHSTRQSGHTRTAGPDSSGNSAPAKQASPQVLPPELWPLAWQQRLARTRPGRIAWTYRELGRDFLSAEDPATARRREFFGRLIRDLSHPAGSHTFWPACLPARTPDGSLGENQYDPRVYWSGLKKLGARGIVVMDREVARAIGLPDTLRPLQQIMHNGFFVWFLWDAEVMSNDLERYGSMLAYLRSALRMIVNS